MKNKYRFTGWLLIATFFLTLGTLIGVKSVLADSITVSNATELQNALKNPKNTDVILKAGTYELGETLNITQTVTLKNQGNVKFVRAKTFKKTMVEIAPNAKVILQKDNSGDFSFDSEKRSVADKAAFYLDNYSIKNEGQLTINGVEFKNVVNSSVIYTTGKQSELVINDINVHDNEIPLSNRGIYQHRAPIRAAYGGKLILNGGHIHHNRYTNYSANAIYVSDGSEFVMNGGLINKNGQSINDGTLANVTIGYGDPWDFERHKKDLTQTPKQAVVKATFNGGKIHDNYACFGGGLGIFGKTDVSIPASSKLVISENASFYGGGILVLDSYVKSGEMGQPAKSAGEAPYAQYYEWYGPKLVMAGGTIKGNWVYKCGGGIAVSANGVVLLGGKIIDNVARDQGGGVYVTTVPYRLNVKNALITKNQANGSLSTYVPLGIYKNQKAPVTLNAHSGGGVWFCPTGQAEFYSQKGAVIVDNQAPEPKGAGDDFWSTKRLVNLHLTPTETSKDYAITLPEYLPNGAPITYYNDAQNQRYVAGKTAPLPAVRDNLEDLALKATVNAQALAFIKPEMTLLIAGNSASKGGGIGSNGSVVFGEKDQELTVKVVKKWKNVPLKNQKPVKVEVRAKLGQQDWLIKTVELNKNNNWQVTIKHLPRIYHGEKLTDLIYLKEIDNKDYQVSYAQPKIVSLQTTVEATYDVTNELAEKTAISVQKEWKGKKAQAVKVVLLANGHKTDQIKTLNAANNWKAEFKDLLVKDQAGQKIVYTIQEVGAQNGKIKLGKDNYQVKITGDMKKGFKIVNAYQPPNDEYPPTGEKNHPTLIGLVGLGMIGLASLVTIKQRRI
ncbi:Cna B-type domain-containing protein [Ligilactobacillus ceti]|uniref:CNA-B domain-containing protein n=1 Tax=Ligilactobacillus ceti DSM 22408 TaxID=1122146 RepID=A0A0R2KGA6_9LACO|nr:Cna B-type domain-containing protein [Ligilactobacillus ceti]KRN88424.1 hypothetical protein IV53_GL000388 [Ligilactobacillus ceti DSM 22408]